MPQAAIPDYLKAHLNYQNIAPGHIFSLYFKIWRDNWSKLDDGKESALTPLKILSAGSHQHLKQLQQRQQYNAAKLQQDSLLYQPAIGTSPFVTGLGNEHPLENGFAFLNPYGLPYLPGSSIKGVLRAAAEELALGLYEDSQGWDMLKVWYLFGLETGSSYLKGQDRGIDVLDEETQRRKDAYLKWAQTYADNGTLLNFIKSLNNKGVMNTYQEQPQQFLLDLQTKNFVELSFQGCVQFWGAYPQCKNMAIDILTPHHGGYFKGDNAPHDSEQPIPNLFLTLPPNTEFDFYCQAETARLPESISEEWKTLLQVAFTYAFDWMGFGAKTAVGYGQMQVNTRSITNYENLLQNLQKQEEENEQKKVEAERLASLSPLDKEIEEFLKFIQTEERAPRLLNELEKGRWDGDEAITVALKIKTIMEQDDKWIPDFSGSNKQKKKLQARCNKVLSYLG